MSSSRYVSHSCGFLRLKAERMGFNPIHLTAEAGLRYKQEMRTVLHIPIWRGYTRTGGVSHLIGAFKASSKMVLINIRTCFASCRICNPTGAIRVGELN